MNDVSMIDTDDLMDTDMAITPVSSYPQLDQLNALHNLPGNQNHSKSVSSAASKPLYTHPTHLQARNRTDSLISIDTTYTTYTVRTNADQTHYQPGNPQHNFSRNRQNSTASLSSSVFSEVPPPQLENYSFTSQFDDELYSCYIAYSQQPNITPFDIRYPPSGVLSFISKLFLENNILDGAKIQIDSRYDVNTDLLLDSNRHKVLAVIRLRLIQLCNNNLNTNGDHYMFNDQLPISRTNSIASAISLGDRVYIPSMMQSNTDLASSAQQVPPPMVHRPSWLHMPALYAAKENSGMVPSSTDSLVDRVPFSLSNNTNSNTNINANANNPSNLSFFSTSNNKNNNNSNIIPLHDTIDPNTPGDLNTPPTTAGSGASKKERPSLNLHMPSFLKYRAMNNQLPQRPQFSTGPLTPGTPGTPPVGPSAAAQRNPSRSARSGSLSNTPASYFALPQVANPVPPVTPNGISKPTLLNPTLNHVQSSHASPSFVSNIDLNSPFEQACPSPLAFPAPQSQLTADNSLDPVSTVTPTAPAGTSSELYNVTAARKRDSLKLKRGLN